MKRIAWSTRSASNGLITRWSRWHLTTHLIRGERTLCGEKLPFAKWVTAEVGKGDYRIRGGECRECAKRKGAK